MIKRLSIFVFYLSFTLLGHDDSLSKPFWNIKSKGYSSGTIPLSDISSLDNSSNNHGSIWGVTDLYAGFDSLNCIKLSAELSTPDFSTVDSFHLQPRLKLKIGKHSKKRPMQWEMQIGTLDLLTVGHGLTIKDFRQIGATGNLSTEEFKFYTALLGQGYKVDEDILIFGIDHTWKKVTAGLNSVIWRIQGISDKISFRYWDQYYLSTYILPTFSFILPDFQLYLETGLKLIDEKDVDNYFNSTENVAYAFLSGVKYSTTFFNINISINPEIRFYSKGFIPVTGLDKRHLISLDHKILSQNNWIDFFDSHEKSFWYYHSIYIESPPIKDFSLFAKNELLLFNSSQDTLTRIVENEKVILSYSPSTSYYWAGIKYDLNSFTNIKVQISNHMLNKDHAAVYNYEEYGHQYMRRFYVTETPLLELLIDWHF